MIPRPLRLVVVALVLIGAGLLAWWAAPRYYPHRELGRSAEEWLRFAERAALRVSYRAEGASTAYGASGRFVLNQGSGGAYTMQVRDAAGRTCTIGFDGDTAWYSTEHKSARASNRDALAPLAHDSARLRGRTARAGREAVRVTTQDGEMEKDLALDARTGVILAMTTRVSGREISRMTVDTITYQPVIVRRCSLKSADTLRPATPADTTRLIGGPALRPAWLPKGFVERPAVVHHCDCCGHEMVGVRYGNGLRSVTLLETARAQSCIEHGCYLTSGPGLEMETRVVGNVAVIAVGDLDAPTLTHLLNTLR